MPTFTNKFKPGDKVFIVSNKVGFPPKQRLDNRNRNKVWTVKGYCFNAYTLEGDDEFRWFEIELGFAEQEIENKNDLLNSVL